MLRVLSFVVLCVIVQTCSSAGKLNGAVNGTATVEEEVTTEYLIITTTLPSTDIDIEIEVTEQSPSPSPLPNEDQENSTFTKAHDQRSDSKLAGEDEIHVLNIGDENQTDTGRTISIKEVYGLESVENMADVEVEVTTIFYSDTDYDNEKQSSEVLLESEASEDSTQILEIGRTTAASMTVPKKEYSGDIGKQRGRQLDLSEMRGSINNGSSIKPDENSEADSNNGNQDLHLLLTTVTSTPTSLTTVSSTRRVTVESPAVESPSKSKSAGKPCSSKDDCDVTEFCTAQVCILDSHVKSCGNNSDCARWEMCSGNLCHPLEHNCQEQEEYWDGHICKRIPVSRITEIIASCIAAVVLVGLCLAIGLMVKCGCLPATGYNRNKRFRRSKKPQNSSTDELAETSADTNPSERGSNGGLSHSSGSTKSVASIQSIETMEEGRSEVGDK